MNVTVAKSSGFCFGVKNAVSAAQEAVNAQSDGRKLVMEGSFSLFTISGSVHIEGRKLWQNIPDGIDEELPFN